MLVSPTVPVAGEAVATGEVCVLPAAVPGVACGAGCVPTSDGCPVGVDEGVIVTVEVCVAVPVAEAVEVGVWVAVGDGVAVDVDVEVAVAVAVAVGVDVAVGGVVAVAVAVAVAVGVGVEVAVGVDVAVGVGVEVEVGVGGVAAIIVSVGPAAVALIVPANVVIQAMVSDVLIGNCWPGLAALESVAVTETGTLYEFCEAGSVELTCQEAGVKVADSRPDCVEAILLTDTCETSKTVTCRESENEVV